MDDELAFAGPGPSGPAAQPGNVPCAVCGARTAMCCSACEAVFYCSPACQQRDWKEHWRVCGTAVTPSQPQQAQAPRARSPGGRSPGAPADSDDGEGFQVALPQSNFAHAAASQAAATSAARDRRLRLRVSAVLAAREGRHQDALQHAAEAYEVAQRIGSLYAEGKSMADEGGVAELEGPALVELLIIVRAALAINDFGTGLGFLEMLTATVDRLAGVGGNPSILQPSEAASLLYCTSELCSLYNHEDRAEDYAHAYLGVVRLAHGEGSKEVGDAHGYICGLFSRRKRYEEAVLHASSTLKIRQRHASYGAEKPVADAYWNLAVLQYQLGQHRAALDSLEASREIHVRLSGEGVATSNVDLALGQVWTILGEAGKAMRSYRQAVRWRQRTLGFAHAETRRAAGLLAAAEIEAHAEEEWRKDVEAEMDEEEEGGGAPVARPRPRQRPREPEGSPGGGGGGREMVMAQGSRAIRGEPAHQAAPPGAYDETPASSPDNIYIPGDTGLQLVDAVSPSDRQGASGKPRKAKNSVEAWEEQDKARSKIKVSNAIPLGHGIIECVAGDNDKPLGMTPFSVPPGQVFLKIITPGMWADRQGIKVGMELLTINKKDVQQMTQEEFKTSLRQTPVTITVGPGKLASGKSRELQSASGKPAPNKAGSVAGNRKATEEAQLTTFAIPEFVKTIGCLFTAVPPGPVYIRQVDIQSWAEEQAIKVGWELVSLNGERCDTMPAETFRTAMRSRPLTLAFNAKAMPTQEELDKQGWRPSVTGAGFLQASPDSGSPNVSAQALPRSRKETIAALFQAADVNKKGRLKRAEMYSIVKLMGFTDVEEEFQDEYEELCADFNCSAKVGLDLGAFEACLSDQASEDYYRGDKELQGLLQTFRKT